jgi:hypothetical protein
MTMSRHILQGKTLMHHAQATQTCPTDSHYKYTLREPRLSCAILDECHLPVLSPAMFPTTYLTGSTQFPLQLVHMAFLDQLTRAH